MSYRPTSIGQQVQLDQPAARQAILSAFRKGGANARNAAELLGVAEKTFHRHVAKLGMAAELAKLRAVAKEKGWLSVAAYGEKAAEKAS